MVTNVSEKDKALQEVIDWCEQREIEGLRLANALLMQRTWPDVPLHQLMPRWRPWRKN